MTDDNNSADIPSRALDIMHKQHRALSRALDIMHKEQRAPTDKRFFQRSALMNNKYFYI
jgi:hypothetical protein